MENQKTCIKCGLDKALTEFVKRGEGYRGICKPCYAGHHKKYSSENRSHINLSRTFNRGSRHLNGVCRVCTNDVIPGKKVCEKHYVVDVASKTLGRANSKMAEELLARFHQNPYCPYTGEVLTLGVNAHLDHIKSQKNHPELKGDINNIEWVSEAANLSKNGFNKDEFIEFCKLVAKSFG